MSAYDDDAGSAGDYLADLVTAGKLTDRDVLAYLAGDTEARAKVAAIAEEDEG